MVKREIFEMVDGKPIAGVMVLEMFELLEFLGVKIININFEIDGLEIWVSWRDVDE